MSEPRIKLMDRIMIERAQAAQRGFFPGPPPRRRWVCIIEDAFALVCGLLCVVALVLLAAAL